MNWLNNIFRKKTQPQTNTLFGHRAKQELEGTVERLLLAHHRAHGADSLLKPDLRIIARGTEIAIAEHKVNDAIAEVELRELPTVLSFLVVREQELAVPRDVVTNIATEAARLLARRINALAKSI